MLENEIYLASAVKRSTSLMTIATDFRRKAFGPTFDRNLIQE